MLSRFACLIISFPSRCELLATDSESKFSEGVSESELNKPSATEAPSAEAVDEPLSEPSLASAERESSPLASQPSLPHPTASEEPQSEVAQDGLPADVSSNLVPEIEEVEDSQSEIKMIAEKAVQDSVERGTGDDGDAVWTGHSAITSVWSCSTLTFHVRIPLQDCLFAVVCLLCLLSPLLPTYLLYILCRSTFIIK